MRVWVILGALALACSSQSASVPYATVGVHPGSGGQGNKNGTGGSTSYTTNCNCHLNPAPCNYLVSNDAGCGIPVCSDADAGNTSPECDECPIPLDALLSFTGCSFPGMTCRYDSGPFCDCRAVSAAGLNHWECALSLN
jgi:hypothetical protein